MVQIQGGREGLMNAFSVFERDATLFRHGGNGCRQEVSEYKRPCVPDGNQAALGLEEGPEDAGSAVPAERRRLHRHTQRLPLALSVFNRAGFQEAWLVNYCQDGICAESSQQLLPGTSIQVRIDATTTAREMHARKEALFSGLPTMALGEVKWCRPLDCGSSPRYRIGIRYYPHY
jgi:hypothetical protein